MGQGLQRLGFSVELGEGSDFLDPKTAKSEQTNSQNSTKIAKKAIILHTVGVQVEIRLQSSGFRSLSPHQRHQPTSLCPCYICIWVVYEAIRGFPKIRGTILGSPYKKDYSILGSTWGSPYFGKLPYRGYLGLYRLRTPLRLLCFVARPNFLSCMVCRVLALLY